MSRYLARWRAGVGQTLEALGDLSARRIVATVLLVALAVGLLTWQWLAQPARQAHDRAETAWLDARRGLRDAVPRALERRRQASRMAALTGALATPAPGVPSARALVSHLQAAASNGRWRIREWTEPGRSQPPDPEQTQTGVRLVATGTLAAFEDFFATLYALPWAVRLDSPQLRQTPARAGEYAFTGRLLVSAPLPDRMTRVPAFLPGPAVDPTTPEVAPVHWRPDRTWPETPVEPRPSPAPAARSGPETPPERSAPARPGADPEPSAAGPSVFADQPLSGLHLMGTAHHRGASSRTAWLGTSPRGRGLHPVRVGTPVGRSGWRITRIGQGTLHLIHPGSGEARVLRAAETKETTP